MARQSSGTGAYEPLREEWERQQQVYRGRGSRVGNAVAAVVILGAFLVGLYLLGAIFPVLPIGPR